MRPVEQTSFYRPDHHPLGPSRGNCVAACIASVFEIPITQASATADGDGQSVMRWTTDQYPALRCEHRVLRSHEGDLDPDSWREWPALGSVFNPGYWIAGVYSFRIPDRMMVGCGCTERVPGGDPSCRWCEGKPGERKLGMLWGTHAVVMHGRELAWDPHPRRADGVGPISGQYVWRVVDPALL